MEVILLQRVEKLGHMGELVRVRPGYARNYLLPQNKAVRATEENRKRFEARRSELEALNKEQRSVAETEASQLGGLMVTLIRQAGESGQLYGSVNARDIADAISATGTAVQRQHIKLSQPIKSLGVHAVSLGLHPEVSVTIRVNVARSMDEAEMQARTGRAVAGLDEREEAAEAAAELEEALANEIPETDEEPEATA